MTNFSSTQLSGYFCKYDTFTSGNERTGYLCAASEGVFDGIYGVSSMALISGAGSWIISGYNTAAKEEKAKDDKKIEGTMGIGLFVIVILIL
mgnify:CR=1 FL=1